MGVGLSARRFYLALFARPCSLEVLDEIFESVPDADTQKITSANVRDLYRL